MVRPKVVQTTHYCEQEDKFITREYRDATSTKGIPTSSAYPTQVRISSPSPSSRPPPSSSSPTRLPTLRVSHASPSLQLQGRRQWVPLQVHAGYRAQELFSLTSPPFPRQECAPSLPSYMLLCLTMLRAPFLGGGRQRACTLQLNGPTPRPQTPFTESVGFGHAQRCAQFWNQLHRALEKPSAT